MIPLLVGVAVFAAAALMLGRRRGDDPAHRIKRLVERRTPAAPQPEAAPAGLLSGPVAASERYLTRVPGWNGFVALLERAGVTRRPARVAWAGAASLILAALVGLALGGAFVAVFFALLVPAGGRLLLALRAFRRRRAFEEQLPDVLAEIGSALRAGHGFLQAMQAVAADAPAPVGPELERALAETRLGRPIDDALLAAGARVGSSDFDFVLESVVVQRQVGGSLAGIFEIVGESVRQRQQFALKLRALTATGRLSAGVLLGLPVVIGAGLTLLNRSYMSPLVQTSTGRLILFGGVALVVVGSLWLHRIVSGIEG